MEVVLPTASRTILMVCVPYENKARMDLFAVAKRDASHPGPECDVPESYGSGKVTTLSSALASPAWTRTLPYTRRRKIPVPGLTRRASSTETDPLAKVYRDQKEVSLGDWLRESGLESSCHVRAATLDDVKTYAKHITCEKGLCFDALRAVV